MRTNSSGRFRFAVDVPEDERSSFQEAFTVLSNMLDGQRPLDLRGALFAAERPVMSPPLSPDRFSGMIDKLALMVRARLVEEGLDPENAVAKHYGLQLLFTDTLVDPGSGRAMAPLRYDLEDFMGDEDPGQTTVGKLLLTGEGQCRSMPLLYLAVAEALGADAYWAFSPNHSYVKFRDDQGTFHNFETTNGHLASDAWVAGSGFVRSEAIKNRVYLDTVGTRKVIAHLLVDLAIAYEHRFGYDERFMGSCLEKALANFPNDIHAWLQLSNLRTACFDRAAARAGYPSLQQLPAPLARELQELQALYRKVDGMGYSEMPAEAYAAWLRSLEAEKQARAEQELGRPVFRTPLGR